MNETVITKNPVRDSHGRREQDSAIKANTIKLGIDVHADSYSVVRQMDGATPQPAQKMTPADFLEWAAKQTRLAHKVYSCYEAGPFGYGLHRKLTELGIENVVVRPQNWDELGKGVKTDKTDGLALVQRLDRYVAGNKKAFAVVNVPTVEQEQARAVSRHREQLREHRQRLEAQGRSLLLNHGIRAHGRWWLDRNWEMYLKQTPEALAPILTVTRDLILAVHEQVIRATRKLEAEASPQPKSFGALTSEVLRREIKDWNNFRNRRQVASITGMCPGVRSSGPRTVGGSITKHGNPRLRRALVELSWRVARFQPEYTSARRWRKVLRNPMATRAAKKKAIVALGRRLAIDLWRIHTGRTTPEALKLIMAK